MRVSEELVGSAGDEYRLDPLAERLFVDRFYPRARTWKAAADCTIMRCLQQIMVVLVSTSALACGDSPKVARIRCYADRADNEVACSAAGSGDGLKSRTK